MFTLLTALVAASMPLSAMAATPVDLPCMQQAVVTRETAVLSAFSVYTQTVMTAFQQRVTGLQNAWTIQDEQSRKATVQTTWTNYKNALKNARNQLKTARKNAWKNFRDARKTCRGPGNSDIGGGESVDSSL